MPERYEPTADIEVLLEALKKHANKESFRMLAYEEDHLVRNTKEMQEAQTTLDYKAGEVAESKESVRKARIKVAQIITTLSKLGCPMAKIQDQWQDYNHQSILPWPSAHEIAEWLKNGG